MRYYKKVKAFAIMIIILGSFFSQTQLILQSHVNGQIQDESISTAQNDFVPINFNLKEIAQYGFGQDIVDVAIKDNFLFVADQALGLLIVNISTIINPILADTYKSNDGSVYNIIIDGNRAFVAHGREGLKILDISDPYNVEEISSYYDGGIIWKIFLANNYLYLVNRLLGLEIIDISDIENPYKIGLYAGQPYDVTVDEKYAFIAAGPNQGLEVVDISDPIEPKKIGELKTEFEDTVGIERYGDYVLLANKEDGLKIVKITRPRNPKLMTVFSDIDDGSIWDIHINGSFAYASGEDGGLFVIDITIPDNPRLVARYKDSLNGKTFNVRTFGKYIFVADYTDGVEVLLWKTKQPVPMEGQYIEIDSKQLNFNHSVGPFAISAFLGNETLGLNLSLYLDVGLMSLIDVTVEAPEQINPGEYINLKIGMRANESIFWGRFEGTIELLTPWGSSEVFSLEDVGVPEYIGLSAFKTFIGENIVEDTSLNRVTLWEDDILNYSLSLIMTPYFNVTGSAIIYSEINATDEYFKIEWTNDGEEVIVPIRIPKEIDDVYGLPLEDLKFIINDLLLDFDKLRFDLYLYDIISIYSWELNFSSVSFLTPDLFEGLNYKLLYPNQPNNQTLLFLDGNYTLTPFIIYLYMTGSIEMPTWALFLTIIGIIAVLILPWVLILISSRRRNRPQNN